MKKTVSVIEEDDGDIFGNDNSTTSYDWLQVQSPPQTITSPPTVPPPVISSTVPPPVQKTSFTEIPPPSKAFESVPLTPASPDISSKLPVEQDDLFSNSNTSYLQELSNQFSNTFLDTKPQEHAHPTSHSPATSFSNIPLTPSATSVVSTNTPPPQPSFFMPSSQAVVPQKTPTPPSMTPTLPSSMVTTTATNPSAFTNVPLQNIPLQHTTPPMPMMMMMMNQPPPFAPTTFPQQFKVQQETIPSTNLFFTPHSNTPPNLFQPIPSGSHTPNDGYPMNTTNTTTNNWSLQSSSFFQTNLPNLNHQSSFKNTSSSFDAFSYHRVPKMVTAFGFGGKFLVSNSQNKFHVYHLSTLLNQTDYVAQYEQFPYPLFSFVPQQTTPQQTQLLLSYIQSQIQFLEKSSRMATNPKRERAHVSIWQLLYILVLQVTTSQTMEQFVDQSMMQVMQSILQPNSIPQQQQQQQQQENDIVLHNIEEESIHLPMLEQYLLQGKMEECYQYCLQYKLWSHAFVLSSMISKKAFQNVILQFTKEQIPSSNSLKLLYGSFTDCVNIDNLCQTPQEKQVLLQNWYKQLNGIIANGSKDMEKMIDVLGDALGKDANNLEASHFCHVLSNVLCLPLTSTQNELNLLSTGTLFSKMVLLGGDHRYHKRQYIHLNSLQKQEVLEYILHCKATLSKMTHFNPQYLIFRFLYIYYMSDLISNSPIMMEKFSTTLDQLVKTVEASKHKIHYHAYFVYQLQVLKHRFTASSSNNSSSGHVATAPHSASSHNRMSLGISSLFRKFIPGGSSATNTSTPSMQLTQPTMNIQQPQQVIAPQQQQVVQPQPQVVQPQQQQVQQQVQQPQPSPTSKQEKRSDSASLWSKLNPFKRTASSSSPKADGSNARSANMGESNKLYYNEEIKRWIPIGADPKDYIEELPPPPPETLSTSSSSSVDTPSAMMMMASTSLTDSYSGSSKYVGFGFATTATPNPSTTGSATPPVPPMATSNTTSSNPSPYPTQFFMPPMNTSQPPAFFMPSANAAVSNEAVPAYSSGYEIPQFVPSFQPTSQEQPPPQQ